MRNRISMLKEWVWLINHRHVEQKYTICSPSKPFWAIWSPYKPVFHRYLPIGCAYSTHRRLELEIWRFSCRRQQRRQTDKLIALPLAHARGVIIFEMIVQIFIHNLPLWSYRKLTITSLATYFQLEFHPQRILHTLFLPAIQWARVVHKLLKLVALNQNRPRSLTTFTNSYKVLVGKGRQLKMLYTDCRVSQETITKILWLLYMCSPVSVLLSSSTSHQLLNRWYRRDDSVSYPVSWDHPLPPIWRSKCTPDWPSDEGSGCRWCTTSNPNQLDLSDCAWWEKIIITTSENWIWPYLVTCSVQTHFVKIHTTNSLFLPPSLLHSLPTSI